jgi:hypothetical protein
MSGLAECRREAEVVAAVSGGRWPAGADPALVEHVAACAVCAEVLEVAQVMAPLERETLADARIPSPGQVWWRAQVRARDEARRAAALPLLAAQGLGAAAVVGLVAALVSWQWPALVAAAGSWVVHPVAALDLGAAAWLGVAMAAVLGPLAIYAAVRE